MEEYSFKTASKCLLSNKSNVYWDFLPQKKLCLIVKTAYISLEYQKYCKKLCYLNKIINFYSRVL